MSDFDSDNLSENEWDESGDLAWNEFDWEVYLREQEEAIHRYLGFYESFKSSTDRIDDTAAAMGWDQSEGSEEPAESDEIIFAEDIYTLHKNPVFISTKALYLSLRRSWELMAVDPRNVSQSLAVGFLASIQRGEEQALMAIHALDFGDYAMAICLFKRSLAAINQSFSLLGSPEAQTKPAVIAYAEQSRPLLFDLREIWLRVMQDCRQDPNFTGESES